MRVKSSLEELFEYDNVNIELFLKNYFIRKYEESRHMRFPYKGSETFYVLCRTVCAVTHELFADAVNDSGVLEEFSSSDLCDEAFGSVGTWEDIEDEVSGAAGLPPFSDSFVEKVIHSCEKHVKTKRPFCRIYLLPFEDSGLLPQRVRSASFSGEVVAVMEPRTLSVRHQRGFFEVDSEGGYNDCRPDLKTALVLWVNESYRRLHPVPLDVDECFVAWAIEAVGVSSVLDFGALGRSFPSSCRKRSEKAHELICMQ